MLGKRGPSTCTNREDDEEDVERNWSDIKPIPRSTPEDEIKFMFVLMLMLMFELRPEE